MRRIVLRRIYSGPDRVWGYLFDAPDGMPFSMTLERPWLDNHCDVSCIPAGIYVCKRIVSPKFGETFEVTDVPGRSAILFHAGNVPEDSHGCILLGNAVTLAGHTLEIRDSRQAVAGFMGRLAGVHEFELVVESCERP